MRSAQPQLVVGWFVMAEVSGKSSVRFDATLKRSGKDVERDATGVGARVLPSSTDGGGPSSDLMAMAMYVPAPRLIYFPTYRTRLGETHGTL